MFDTEEIIKQIDIRAYYTSHLGSLGKANSGGYTKNIICPFHDESDGSFGVNVITGHFKCFGCDAGGSLVDFEMRVNNVGFNTALKQLAAFAGIDPHGEIKHFKLGKPVKMYPYYDSTGNLLFYVCRFNKPKKDFRPCDPNGNWKVKGIEPVPYNLSQVSKADTIFLPEGEKDADTINQFGFVAICKANWTGRWTPEYAKKYVAGKTVYICQDADKAGKKKAIDAAKALSQVEGVSVKIIPPFSQGLMGKKKGYDVTDWVADGGTKEALLGKAQDALYYIGDEKFNGSAGGYADNIKESIEVLKELNNSHATIMVSGKFLIINEIIDPVLNISDFTLSSVFDFKNRYANKKIADPNNPGKKINLARAWLESGFRREYEGIIFDPNSNDPRFYNLYRGLAVKPAPGNWSLFYDHIFENIAGGNQKICDWIIAWFARILQDPGGKRPGTAIVFRGGQGTGKGLVVNFFGKIFGAHYSQIAHGNQISGRFNSHMKGMILVFADEAVWGGDKTAEGVIKNLITEPTLSIEQKGRDVIQIQNHVNLVMASNSSWVCPAGLDERRFFVIDVSSTHQQDHGYFKAIVDQMENGGIEAMFHDLLEKDISGVNLRTFEQTAGLFEQKLYSMDTVQKYWFERLSDGCLRPIDPIEPASYGEHAHGGWTGKINTTDQHADYLKFAGSINDRFPLCETQFALAINKLCKDAKKTRKRMGEKRVYVRVFPSLAECRAEFDALIKMDVEWEKKEGQA